MSIFVDTSAFYASADRKASNRERVQAMLKEADRLVTTDHVLLEAWSLFEGRLGRAAAQSFWTAARDGAVETATVGLADLEHAWQIGQDFADQPFSFVDMTSFAVMERMGVTRVATLDHHFAVYRYGPRRNRAFEIAG